mmetsp:Transcript_60854/g.188411  ORF Transcript_60854/g.188411 Transcript_60854/m.188411 type:complete len:435 (+) Transcript_60854:119-1423(+)
MKATRRRLLLVALSAGCRAAGQKPGDPFCFGTGAGYSWETCCHPGWGRGGNLACWDAFFSHSLCCSQEVHMGAAGTSGLRVELLDPDWQADEFRRWDGFETRFRLKQFLQENIEWDQLRVTGHRVYLLSDIFQLVGSSRGALEYLPGLDRLSDGQMRTGMFVPFFASDDDAYSALSRIVQGGGSFQLVPFEPVKSRSPLFQLNPARSRYIWTDRHAYTAIKASVKAVTEWDRLHVNVDGFEAICQILSATKRLPGVYVEIGVFEGASATAALNYLREADIRRDVFLLDTFAGFTYDAAFSSAEAGWAGTHLTAPSPEKAIGVLRSRLSPAKGAQTNLYFHQFDALGEAPLPIPAGSQIAAALVDVDLFEATEAALGHVAPRVPVGGMIFCDDPSGTPVTAGALLGFERFLSSEGGRAFAKLMLGTSWVLIRVRA